MVWRTRPRLIVWTGLFWALAVVGVLGAWLAWLDDRTGGRAVHAAVSTVVIAAFSLVLWLVLFRPRVEVGEETVVIVNPLATYRLRRTDIVAVEYGGNWAAYFHRGDGFKFRAVALGEASAGIRDRRVAEVRDALGL